MQALAVTAEAPAGLQLKAVPEPGPLAAGEVLVRVLASTMNRGERSRLEAAADGHVFGWDVVGEVMQTGDPAADVGPGDRVAALSLPGGGWAERVTLRGADLSLVPDDISSAAAATVPVAGLTALRAVKVAPVLLGAKVLIVGGGAVAWFAAQLALLGGAQVSALVRSVEATTRLAQLSDRLQVGSDAPPEASYDLVIDTIGGAMTPVALAACRPFGQLVLIGNVGGPTAGLTPSTLVAAGCVVTGYRLVVDATARPVGRELRDLLTWISQGRVRTPPLHEVSWADSGLLERAVAGRFGPDRVVLRMDQR